MNFPPFSFPPFVVLKCYVQKLPSTLSERTLSHMFFPYKILASISFYINVPFTGHITLLLAPFCMHICRIISSSPILMPLGREEYIIGIFLVCLSVLSVRIILDTAYSRNMGGSWARDWENLFRVSFLNLPK